MYDVSIILNVHNEARFIKRAIRSLSEAAEFAHHNGVSTELVIVIDCGNEPTISAVRRAQVTGFANVQIVECENRSLGLSRNAGCDVAKGEYLCPQDADDLVSFNYFAELANRARHRGKNTILFPEWLIAFGASWFVRRYYDVAHTRFLMVHDHPFNSRAFFHQSVYERQRYGHPDTKLGLAYEDYLFNATAIANGYELDYCEDIVLYYRQRPTSIMAATRQTARRFEVPHNPLFSPAVYLERFQSDYQLLRSGAWTVTPRYDLTAKFCESNMLSVLTAAANRIDPIVDIRAIASGPYGSYVFDPIEPAAVYYEMCQEVGDRSFTDVFILPSLCQGDAQRYILDVMHGLSSTFLARDILVVTGERVEAHTWRHKLPSNVTFIDLFALGPSLHDEQRERLLARLIMAVAPVSRIHVQASRFGHGLVRHHDLHFKQNKIVYYRFYDKREFSAETLVTAGSGPEFVCDELEDLSLIISDNSATIAEDVDRIDFEDDKWICLPMRIEQPAASVRLSAGPTSRLLWVSPLDTQHRTTLLRHLVAQLSERLPEVTLDVYGTPDDGHAMDMTGLSYQGAASGMADIPLGNYDALIYTSWYDGLPSMILDAMAGGLPVIAPDIGGISGAIDNECTGLLLDLPFDDAQAASHYVKAVEWLYGDFNRRALLSKNGLEYINRRHGQSSYLEGIRRIFGETNERNV